MNRLLKAALRYADLGYRVFPCAPGRKTPITPNGFKDATTDTEQIETWWKDEPEANIGVATEGLVVIDIDTRGNRWLADMPDRQAELAIGPLSLTANGGKQYVFRQPPNKAWRNTTGRLAPKVDTRADGGYIVVPPSVLHGDRRYRWAPNMDLDDPPERLPEPPDWLVERLDQIAARSHSSPRVASSDTEANTIPEGQRNSALASLAGTMRRVGMSKSEIAAALRQANGDRCRPPLPEAEVERIAASVSRYEPDQIATAVVEDHWSQLWESESAPEKAVDPGPFPKHLLAVPGFISQVVEYNLQTAHRPQPILALAGAVCLQAVLAARKVCDERENRTNLYAIVVAGSGEGKEHARKVTSKILFHAGLAHLDGHGDLASDAGLVMAVESQPNILLQVDEFGRFLRTIGDPKKAPYLFNIIGTLMKLYSSADTVFRGKAYADPKRNRTVDQPCVVLYGTTVPENFFESLTADSLSDGFIARLLVFEACKIPKRQRKPFDRPPESVLSAARWWAEMRCGANLAEEHPEPRVVPATASALRIFDELADRVDDELASGPREARALWARAEEKACRLALVYACSADRENLEINEAAAKWACELSAYLTERMLALAQQWIADGAFDALQKKVMRAIRQAGGRIGRNELCRRTQSLSVRTREEIIQNLLATGQIEEQNESNGPGRPKTWYVVR